MIDLKKLKTQIQNREFDNVLGDIYGTQEDILAKQRERYQRALTRYEELFGAEKVEIYSAPGRTEICGNHTDHQHGTVLAASINLDAIAVASTGNGSEVEFISEGYSPIRFPIDELDVTEDTKGTTTALIKGVIKGMQDRGYRTGSFKAYVTSDVLSGSGLSSSAALESVIGTILSGLYNDMTVSPVDIAIIGQYAENVYFGKPSGLMDQIACSVGDFVHIDFADPVKPVVTKINFDITSEGYRLCIVDTKGSHANLTDDYAAITTDMREVSRFFGKQYLNEITMDEFIAAMPKLYGKVGDRCVLRAFHYLTEVERVSRAAAALKEKRFTDFLEVIRESGNSSYRYLQNVYSNKYEQTQPVPTTLMLSEYYLKDNGVCRVHGGGFAGTIQAFVRKEAVADYKNFIEGILGEGTCHVLSICKQGGIRVL